MGGGPESQTKTWNFVQKNCSFLKKKKLNALNSLKSKINLTFIFHLVDFQTCVVGGWGLMFGTKSQKNVLFDTFLKLRAFTPLYITQSEELEIWTGDTDTSRTDGETDFER